MQGFQKWNYLGKPHFRKMWPGSRKQDRIQNNELVIMNNQAIYINICIYTHTKDITYITSIVILLQTGNEMGK